MSRSGAAGTRIALFGIVALAAAVGSAGAQGTVIITVPVAVSFAVTDVSRSTSGAPSVTTLSFVYVGLGLGKALRVSVQSDAASFSPPIGLSIPALKVTWNSVGASGGIGSGGTLSSSSFGLVFQSNPMGIVGASGRVDLSWTLAAPPSGIRSGNHQLTVRWKVESITP